MTIKLDSINPLEPTSTFLNVGTLKIQQFMKIYIIHNFTSLLFCAWS